MASQLFHYLLLNNYSFTPELNHHIKWINIYKVLKKFSDYFIGSSDNSSNSDYDSNHRSNNNYHFLISCHMRGPVVNILSALILQISPWWRNQRLRKYIIDTSISHTPGTCLAHSSSSINICRVTEVIESISICDTHQLLW